MTQSTPPTDSPAPPLRSEEGAAGSDLLNRGTGNLVRSEPAVMYPQTVHIRDWRIIRIEFHDGQAFC